MKVEIWKLIQFTPNFFDGGILFTLYLYYIFVVSDFQRIAVFSFSGHLSRLRMQRYNIFSNYQNIFKFFLKLFHKSLFFKKKNFNISVFFMLKSMFLVFFLVFFECFRQWFKCNFSRFRIFLCFFDEFYSKIGICLC